jgi:hypothetical protein
LPTAQDLTDSAAGYLTTVPLVSDGVCDICHGAPNLGYRRCFSCAESYRQVARPVPIVVPISLYQIGGQLHHVLRGYKDNPYPGVRARFSLIVAALLTRFLARHGNCVAKAADAAWELATTVPSGRDRPGLHPLDQAIQLSPWLRDQCPPVLARGAGDVRHNRAGDRAFMVTEDVRGRHVLLLDDTFTTGAALQSAASALAVAGAQVVAAVVVGRVIDPGFSAPAHELWSSVETIPFDFERCCLCARG